MTVDADSKQITCALPLYGPRPFIDQAIRYFLRQSHPDRDLLILDAGDTGRELTRSVRRMQSVRVCSLRLPTTFQPWAKPEIIAAVRDVAEGAFVAWWNPQDWFGCQRLAAQFAELERTLADATDVVDGLTYRVQYGDAITSDGGAQPQTALIRRAALGRIQRIASVTDPRWHMHIVEHGKTPHAPTRSTSEVLERLGSDTAFYSAWRSGRPTPPLSPAVNARPLNIAAPLFVYDGLGSMGEYLVRTIASAGVEIGVTPLAFDRDGLSTETLERISESSLRIDDPTLCLAWVGQPLDAFAKARALFVNCMWESTELPPGFAERLNHAQAVIVPSTWVAHTFTACGVRTPINVVPQGVDPDRYHPQLRAESADGLTTLIVASWCGRKNIPESISAWRAAFGDNPTARLIIKSRFSWHRYVPDDPRITFVDTEERTAGIAHWYHRADVLLALGGEGFGLPLIEGMACGLPVIALDAQGQADVCADAGSRVLAVPAARWIDYDDGTYRCGQHAVPDVDAVVDRLRWVRDHRADAADLGQRASEWVLTERNIWQMGPRMLDVIRRHLPADLALASAPTSRRSTYDTAELLAVTS